MVIDFCFYCNRIVIEFCNGCPVSALKIFLNSENGTLCRPLLMQLLTGLWKVHKWARTCKTLRIYSSSLLIAYDARRLRNVLQSNWKNNR